MSQLQVRDEHGAPVVRVSIRIAEGQKPSEEAIFDIVTDFSGNQGWPIPYWPRQDYTLHVNRQDVLPAYQTAEVLVPAGVDTDIAILLPHAVSPTPPPTPGRKGIVRGNGCVFEDEGEAILLGPGDPL